MVGFCHASREEVFNTFVPVWNVFVKNNFTLLQRFLAARLLIKHNYKIPTIVVVVSNRRRQQSQLSSMQLAVLPLSPKVGAGFALQTINPAPVVCFPLVRLTRGLKRTIKKKRKTDERTVLLFPQPTYLFMLICLFEQILSFSLPRFSLFSFLPRS